MGNSSPPKAPSPKKTGRAGKGGSPVKKKGTAKTRSSSSGSSWRIVLAVSFLVVFLVGGIIAIHRLRAPAEQPQKVVSPAEQAEQAYNKLAEQLGSYASELGGTIAWKQLENGAAELVATFKNPDSKQTFDSYISGTPPHEPPVTNPEVSVKPTISPTTRRRVTPGGTSRQIEVTSKLLPSQAHPWVAIIIDDFGYSRQRGQAFIEMNFPVTLSILPGLPHSRAISEAARQAGKEVMLHMPMQPQGWPEVQVENGALLVGLDPDSIKQRVEQAYARVPKAVGVNNHMGSAFTESSYGMQAFLEVCAKHDLFFIDSRTTGRTIGLASARKFAVPAAERSIFLDDTDKNDAAAIGDQLRQAFRVATETGTAIAIGHPYPATERALQDTVPQLQQQGAIFVTAEAIATLLSADQVARENILEGQ